jgi:hypothetical protein
MGELAYPGLKPGVNHPILYKAESNPTIYRDTIYRGEWNRT